MTQQPHDPPTDTRALMDITARPPVVFKRGHGSYLWDSTGKRYLDFVQGWAVNCLGHAPPLIASVLGEQGATLITPSPAYYNAPSLKLAEVASSANRRMSSLKSQSRPTPTLSSRSDSSAR